MTSVGASSNNISTNKVKPNFTPLFTTKEAKEKFSSVLNFFDRITFAPHLKKSEFKNISFTDVPKEKPVINEETKVLIIGDSQTYGSYGTNLDNLARGTKAKVITYASWGSSPEWWFSGEKSDHVWSKGLDGNSKRFDNYNTPLIEKVLKAEKPDVVIVTMGGNMMAHATQENVTGSVNKIGTAITASGAKLFWAGPPKYDPEKRTPEQLETFYGFLAKAVSTHGTLIDSRKFIKEYHGTDGLHYSGIKGKKETAKWATGVFNEIQKTKVK
jgi:hypothetical protein